MLIKNKSQFVPEGDQRKFLATGPRPADILFAVLLCIPVATLRPRWLLIEVPVLAAILVVWALCARRARKRLKAEDAEEKYKGVDPSLLDEEK